MSKSIEDTITDAVSETKNLLKTWIFNIIAVVIIIGMLALSLGVVGHKDITLEELLNVFVETIPFFLCAMLLNADFYIKGTFAGKSTKKFIGIITKYSILIDGFEGKQISLLPDFCANYNQKALQSCQAQMLKKIGMTWETYTDDSNGIAIRHMSKRELQQKFGKEHKSIINTILKCNKLSVTGINVNILLGNLNSNDITYLGPSERNITTTRMIMSGVLYIAATFVLSWLCVNDISTWGWVGIVLIVFKLSWIVCSTYFQYFRGYNDINVKVCNHITRKTDILKEYDDWYKSNIKSTQSL